MNIGKFYEKCLKSFSDSLEQFELYHFTPYYETSHYGEMWRVLNSLKEMGRKAELAVDFNENMSLDCFEEMHIKDGLLHIEGLREGECFREILILKPEKMFVRARINTPSGNFICINNACIKEYVEENELSEIVLREASPVLIHPKGSIYTDSKASHSIRQFLGSKKNRGPSQ